MAMQDYVSIDRQPTFIRLLRRTPFRTFVLYPVITLVWELSTQRETFELNFWFLPLMIWGYLEYLFCGVYRMKYGGGGPGLETPPNRLVSMGPYAYTRNPMYLGHLIFLTGLTLTLKSWLAAGVTIGVAIWFHYRVLGDEKKLIARFGDPYINYMQLVKRWIPGLF
jgi:protein-S-isoprenylcysteine O-methyltransferase Ste14